VADEILKMLTDPSLWDEKAANGVANIHAYMWSSHCLKCLEIIVGEKVSWGWGRSLGVSA
jgi:hypothetical protein